MNTKKWERVLRNMKIHNVEEMIITSPSYIFYLTGLSVEPGERLLAIHVKENGDKKLFINELSKSSCVGLDMAIKFYNDNDDPITILAKSIEKNKIVGIDKNWPSHFLIELINERSDMKFVNSSLIIDEVRMIKDEDELKLLREASLVVDKVVMDLIASIPEKLSEKEMENKVKELFKKYGTDKMSFDPIVAYGANAADPHHVGNNDHAKNGDCVLMDIGGKTNSYCSDTSRTVFLGEPCAEAKKVYEIVLEANIAAMAIIKPGVKFSDIDKTARKIIEKAGYGEFFTHRTGHNIGIEDHEYPDVSTINGMEVQKGMVFSVEPGIYLEGKFGVRIEDLVIVTEDGYEILNHTSKDYKVIKF